MPGKSAIINALRNGAQAASNGVAETVSVPVDLISAGLRGVGVNVPQDAFMGSQYMRDVGLTAPTEPGLATDIGYAAGSVMPALPVNYGKLVKEMSDEMYAAKQARRQAQ
jgi:hypothetical protein